LLVIVISLSSAPLMYMQPNIIANHMIIFYGLQGHF